MAGGLGCRKVRTLGPAGPGWRLSAGASAWPPPPRQRCECVQNGGVFDVGSDRFVSPHDGGGRSDHPVGNVDGLQDLGRGHRRWVLLLLMGRGVNRLMDGVTPDDRLAQARLRWPPPPADRHTEIAVSPAVGGVGGAFPTGRRGSGVREAAVQFVLDAVRRPGGGNGAAGYRKCGLER